MLGNCATGRARMVREPTNTRTMEITIATMGRLIKNFDIGLPSLAFRGKGLGVHLHAGTHLLHALRNHVVAGLQAVRDDPLIADTVSNRYGSNTHFVLVVDNRQLVGALQLRHGTLRHKQSALLDPRDRANFAVPSGPQDISWIGKQPGEANRSGTFIDLAVRKEKFARVRIR